MVTQLLGEEGEPGATLHAPEPERRGLQSADLRILSTLGEGGMGLVRRAEQRSLGREVVVKSLRPDKREEVYASALLREARIAGGLEHPNIVPVHAVGWLDDEGPFIVMKHVDGEPWSARLRAEADEGVLTRRDKLRANLEVFVELCRAVEFAHSKGIIHRDIKPENVMLGAFGEVYLLDWGLALEVGTHASNSPVGTPGYMAPEMADGSGLVGTHSDVYLLGATLHEVLVGRRRHAAQSIDGALLEAVASLPASYEEAVPAELGAIANRACAAKPEERYASASAVREAVVDYLQHGVSSGLTARARLDLLDLEALVAAEGDDLGDTDPARELEVQAQFARCRGRFEEALALWQDNREAREGLARCVALHERRAARALQANEKLRRLRDDRRLFGLNWTRSGGIVFSGVFGLALALLFGWGTRSGAFPLTPRGASAAFLLFALMLIGGSYVLRATIMDSVRFRRFIQAFAVCLLLEALGAWWIHVVGLDLRAFYLVEGMIAVSVAATLMVVLERALVVTVLIAVIALSVALPNVDYALDVIGVAYLVNTVFLAWLVRPRPGAPGSF